MRRPASIAHALAAAVVLASTGAAVAEPPMRPLGSPEPPRFVAGTLRVTSPPSAPGSVYLHWEGTIAAPMAEQLGRVFDAFGPSRRRFVLVLNSGGGSVSEGEKVVALLRRIRRTHTLDTSVGPGQRCGSMCLPLYLQGGTRFGARSSAWLFHEVTRRGSDFGRPKRVEGSYRRLIEDYWVPAGVSRTWIERMLRETDNHDWWQTGADLIADRTGIITQPLENRRRRNLEIEQSMPPKERPAATRAAPAPGGPAAPGAAAPVPPAPPAAAQQPQQPWPAPPTATAAPRPTTPPTGLPASPR